MKFTIVAALFCLAQATDIENFLPVASFGTEPFIIGGSTVQITSHPHQASLQFSSGSHTCGASIIGVNKLVCAAHCTQSSAGSYQIRAGSNSRTSGGQVRSISSITNHGSYCGSCAGFPNDISTLRTSTNLVFGSGVGAISLGSGTIGGGVTCWITGWGRTGSSNTLPTNLMGVQISTITNADCSSRMSNVGGATINSNHLCIYSGSTGSCNGDSGGPMVCNGALHGATSWGVSSGGNCLTSYPSVYTRIAGYASWINNN